MRERRTTATQPGEDTVTVKLPVKLSGWQLMRVTVRYYQCIATRGHTQPLHPSYAHMHARTHSLTHSVDTHSKLCGERHISFALKLRIKCYLTTLHTTTSAGSCGFYNSGTKPTSCLQLTTSTGHRAARPQQNTASSYGSCKCVYK